MSPTPLILDVDTGVDDALALLYAAASPEVELIGATTVMGNVTVEVATTNTLAVLELLGLGDVEVARGCVAPAGARPRALPGRARRTRARACRAAGSLAGAVRRARRRSSSSRRRAIDPGEVLLVATGPAHERGARAG